MLSLYSNSLPESNYCETYEVIGNKAAYKYSKPYLLSPIVGPSEAIVSLLHSLSPRDTFNIHPSRFTNKKPNLLLTESIRLKRVYDSVVFVAAIVDDISAVVRILADSLYFFEIVLYSFNIHIKSIYSTIISYGRHRKSES